MAVLDVTYHSLENANLPVYGGGGYGPVPIVPLQSGDSQQLDFTSAEQQGAVQAPASVARVQADADCRVTVGNTVTDANSRLVKADMPPEVIYIPAGGRITVKAV